MINLSSAKRCSSPGKLLAIICAVLIVLTTPLPAQDISTFFEAELPVPYQKLFVHTDRSLYFQRDTLWFSAYLVDAQSHVPAKQTCNLYIELLDSLGDVLRQETFIIQNGFGAGQLIFSEKQQEGDFVLRAYTDYLKNFPTNTYFTQAIQVTQTKGSDELASIGSHSESSNFVDLAFMPEGGFMLADATNAVAFKAVNEKGQGVAVSGLIMDDKGEVVQTFSSTHLGAGKFYFYTVAGGSFKAVLEGYEQHFALPKARTSGAKIKVVKQSADHVEMVIQEKEIGSEQVFYLAVMHRGNGLFFVPINQTNRNSLLKFSFNSLRDGINRFVLLDDDMNPLSERLIFKQPENLLDLNISTNKKAYRNREEVTMQLGTDLDSSNLASVSVAVVDKSYLRQGGSKFDIAAYLLLDAEFIGYIESPSSYFEDGEVPASTKLDLLMSTSGWSNYIWPTLNQDDVKLSFEPKLGFDFRGKASRNFSKKALSDASVSLIVSEDEGKSRFFDQSLDKRGHFAFKNIVFADSASVVAQARTKRNNSNLQFELAPPRIISPKVHAENLLALREEYSIASNIYEQRLHDETLRSAYDPTLNTIYLEGVEVRGRRTKPSARVGSVRKNDGPYQIDPKNTVGMANIIEYIQYNAPGVTQSPNGGISLIGGASLGGGIDSEPLIYIDGGPRLTVDEARGYAAEMFATIEILTPPASNFYRAPAGAVLLTTKSGSNALPNNIDLLGGMVERIKGFSRYRTFYSPKYSSENIDQEIPDLRYTLYWNPRFIVGGDQPAPTFFSSDLSARYKIVIQGISTTGKVCIGSTEFGVGEE